MAQDVLKIKCRCRPTPSGVPRPPSNLVWLKRGANANNYARHGMGIPFDRKKRNSIVTESGITDGSGGWVDSVFEMECTKCHLVHVVRFSEMQTWWEEYLHGGSDTVVLPRNR